MQPALKIFDLKALREITDGDAEIERQLVRLFCKCADNCIGRLQAMVMSGESEPWHMILHEFKGAAGNIHADMLAELCSKYEHIDAVPDARIRALADIRAAYDALRPLLMGL